MTTFGWDMSHYDAPSIGSAISEGIEFITHKAGGDALDNELGKWWQGVKGLRNRILTGAYWVLYPGNPVNRADAFLARLDDVCPGWRDTDFYLFADCEKWGGNSNTVPPISDVNTFCARLRAQAPKLMPMGYLPQWVYGDKVASFHYPIIQSDYGSNPTGGFKDIYPGDNSARWNIGGNKVAAVLQYGSRATIGGQTTCDANAFRGSLLTLRKMVAPGFYTGGKMYPQTPPIGNYTFPILKLGNDDTQFDGYNGVVRAQTLLNLILGLDLTVDGNYGPKTQAAVKQLMKGGDGKTIDSDEWVRLCGLSAAKK